jgi:Spy/CpxP family protein refolding chaperone
MHKQMTISTVLLALCLLLSGSRTATVSAQADSTPTPSGYRELLNTEIRGLSPDALEAYRTGAGGGLALPAELNGYPGPRHVLDLADELGLTEDQQAEIQDLYDTMLPEAVQLGEQILQAEAALERAFRENTMDETFLEEQLAEIGALQAQLRFVHLRTHIATVEILTPDQIEQYNLLRGYATENTREEGHPGHH